MFAHQAIDDFKKLAVMYPQNKAINAVVKLIYSSQKFHIGEAQDIYNIFGINSRYKAFAGEMAKYQKLPYDICWFDYTVNLNSPDAAVKPSQVRVSKRALLCYSLPENHIGALVFNYYYDNSIDRHSWFPGLLQYVVKVGGNIVDGKYGNTIATPFFPRDLKELPGEMVKEATRDDSVDLCVLDGALKLINCKNVGYDIAKPSSKLNRKRIKNGKCGLFSYHILVIKPSIKPGDGKSNGCKATNRIHLCRGHFKEYTDKQPLFGKYTGLYWWQPHVRGRNRTGVVAKDYSLATAQTG